VKISLRKFWHFLQGFEKQKNVPNSRSSGNAASIFKQLEPYEVLFFPTLASHQNPNSSISTGQILLDR